MNNFDQWYAERVEGGVFLRMTELKPSDREGFKIMMEGAFRAGQNYQSAREAAERLTRGNKRRDAGSV